MAATDLAMPEAEFTRIGNQLLEAIPLAKLNGTQENICIFLWRRTYGWNRTRDAIPLTAFTAACASCKEHISKQIKILIKKHIIRRVFVVGRPGIYSFVADTNEWADGCIDFEALEHNRDNGIYRCAPAEMIDLSEYPDALWSDDPRAEMEYCCDGWSDAGGEPADCPVREELWRGEGDISVRGNDRRLSGNGLSDHTTMGLSEYTTQELTDGTTQELSGSTTPGQVPAPNRPQIETLLNTVTKTDRKTVRNKKEFSADMPAYQLSAYLLKKIKDNIPDYQEPNMQKWSATTDLILRVDKKDAELVREVIDFSQEDSFWCTNIHSPTNLRKHFNQLAMQRKRQRSSPPVLKNRGGMDDWEIESEEYAHFFDRSRD